MTAFIILVLYYLISRLALDTLYIRWYGSRAINYKANLPPWPFIMFPGVGELLLLGVAAFVLYERLAERVPGGWFPWTRWAYRKYQEERTK